MIMAKGQATATTTAHAVDVHADETYLMNTQDCCFFDQGQI